MTDIPDGMTPWHGGDSAPVDWDGGRVWLRELEWCDPADVTKWLHDGVMSDVDIVAYTRAAPVAIDPADYFTDTAFQLTTCDPAFDPAKPVDINGYRYVPERMA